MDPSDEDLMNAIAQKNAKAYRALVARYLDPLFFFARRELNSTADAEDAIQDLFLKIWQRPQSWNPQKGRLKSWLFAVLANLCRDRWRQKKRQQLYHRELDLALDHIVDLAPLPDRQVEAAHQLSYVISCFAQLPKRQRTALYLAIYDELTHQEIARVMHISADAVESLIRRARANLRDMLNTPRQANSHIKESAEESVYVH